MKKKSKMNIKTVIRKIVREEVAMAISEVITELKQPSLSSNQPKKQVKNNISEKKSFTKNDILNDVLNETAGDDSWKTMGDGIYDSSKMNQILNNQYNMDGGETATNTATEAGVSVESLPDHLVNALNRDYTKLVKHMDGKKV